MAKLLRSDTACHIMFGPFLDKTDGVSLEVGAGIITSIDHATTGIFLSKNGAAGVIRHAAVTTSVLDAYGMFQVHLDTTDTDTPGTLRVMMAEAATFLPVWDDYMVIPHELWDTLFVTQPCVAFNKFFDVASSVLTCASINQAGDAHVHADAIDTLTKASGPGDLAAILVDTAVIGALGAGLTALADKTTLDLVHTDVDAILADTTVIGSTGQGLTSLATQASLNTIDGIVDDILVDTGTTLDAALAVVDGNVDSILADTGTDGVVVVAASKTGYALSTAGADAIWARTGTITSLAYQLLLERVYEMINNKMKVTDGTGAVALRNLVDGADIATGSVTDDLTTTIRAGLTWA